MTKRSALPTSVLPAAYEVWGTSEFGQITDRIEDELILRMVGPIQGKRVLDCARRSCSSYQSNGPRSIFFLE
jgi:hypothetical protein